MKKPVGVTLRRVSGAFVFALAIIISQFSSMQFVHAVSTDVWTGTAGDGKFSTATNWQSGIVPVNGDTLSFDAASISLSTTVHNDLTNLSVAGINFNGSNSSSWSYAIDGNAITLTGSIVNTATRSGTTYFIPNELFTNLVLAADVNIQNISYSNSPSQTIDTAGHTINQSSSTCNNLPQLVGSGSLSLSSTAGAFALSQPSPNFSGNITISSGYVVAQSAALGDASGSTTVTGTGVLNLFAPADSSWAEPFNLGGSGYINVEHGSSNGCMGAVDSSIHTATLTGPVTLQSDFKYGSGAGDNLTITGSYTANSHTFTVSDGASGILKLPDGLVRAPVKTNTYSDSQPTVGITIGYNETTTLDGQRKWVAVGSGGILMGNGTADSINADNGGIIAPGHSPGKLTAVQTLTLGAGSIYQAQIQNATAGGYDQIQVSDPSRTAGNDVNIDPAAILNVSLYTGYSINKGDKFTIINNLQPSSQLVMGTFSGMPEGTQFTVGGITFSISYIGGNGNDVVLTALSTGAAPKIPNTGAQPLKLANPAVMIGLGIGAAAILFMLARRRFNN